MRKNNKINYVPEKKHPIEEFLEENNIKKSGLISFLKTSNMMFRYYFNSRLPEDFEYQCYRYLRKLKKNLDDFLKKYDPNK